MVKRSQRPLITGGADPHFSGHLRPRPYPLGMSLLPYTDRNPVGARVRARELPFEFPAWVTSDQHWNHARIVEFEPVRLTLPADHNQVMIERWCEVVADDDTVIHLGDVCLGKKEDFAAISELLPGRKFLMRGNHDRAPASFYEQHGFTLIPEFWLDYRGYRVRFQHRPDYDRVFVCYPKTLVVHGHVHHKSLDDRT